MSNENIINGVRRVIKENGLKYLWRFKLIIIIRGNISGLFLWSTYSGIEFGVFNLLNWKNNLFKGFVSGAIATIISYPFDYIRTYSVKYPKEKVPLTTLQ